MSLCLYHGHVWHGRQQRAAHQFRYAHGWVAVPLDDEPQQLRLAAGIGWRRRQHGPRDGSPLRSWLLAQLQAAGFADACSITLHTMPAVWGRVFNPASFYLVEDLSGALRAVLVEVSNTFGQRHDYLLHQPDFRPIGGNDWLYSQKQLHVSPFYQQEGGYRFRFARQEARLAIRIEYAADGEQYDFAASLQGCGQPLASAGAFAVWRHLGRSTLLSWLLIHWQAWQLWRKGNPFYGKHGKRERPSGQGASNEYS